jgi:long-chain acyl-CoA synthetase
MSFPRWTRSPLSRMVRRAALPTVLLPFTRLFMRLQVDGLAHVTSLTGPVMFAANHQSHMDTPAIYAALPPDWRYRIAPAMAKEFFAAHFGLVPASRRERWRSGLAFYMACQWFNAFPLPQRESPRAAFRYMRELVDEGHSILIYPEGQRTDDGGMVPFKRGVGTLAIHLGLPIVPVRLEGLEWVYPKTVTFPTRGPVRVAFGAAITAGDDDAATLTARVEAAVHALGTPTPPALRRA